MSTPKNWIKSKPTAADLGFMHEDSINHIMLDAYDLAESAYTLEDQTKYVNAIFNGADYSETLNLELFRPITRSEYSLGLTNFLTQSADTNLQATPELVEAFYDFLYQIIAHDWYNETMSAILAYYIVDSGLHVIIPDTFDSDVDQDLYDDIKYFQSQLVGTDNSDSWTGGITKRLPKWLIYEYLGCSQNKVRNWEGYLADVCKELFSRK